MAGFMEYGEYDALGLAALVRKGEVSAAELLNEAVARVDALNPKINALTLRMVEDARAEIARGLPDGPLAGVPFLLKDLGAAIAGRPVTGGSRAYRDHVADHDAEIVLRYRRAGLAIFGRTNSPEMGLSYSTEPLLHGPTRNPWNTAHTPGGSSGGAAAAVAARMVPAAHASDGGGSIRVPASCCGLFGLKPTRGRTPAGPKSGEGWAGMSIHHAVTRSVRDSAALLDATSGADVGDPYWAPPPARPFLDEVGADPGRLRIAVSGRAPNGVPVHPDCLAAMERAARLCSGLGHEVEEAGPDYDNEVLDDARVTVIRAHLLAQIRELGAAASELEPMTLALARMGDAVSGEDYVMAVQAIHLIGRQVARFFLDYDVMLTPTLAKPPLPLGVLDPASADAERYFEEIVAFAAFPPLSNATGAPAMSVPLHWNEAALPIGVQFIGRFGDEATLLRLAAQLEEAAPWKDRTPTVCA
jgi:Asp-tRNA(Asn)/Glu-tRNA(Gln) amidotransferase A subunit family amidase